MGKTKTRRRRAFATLFLGFSLITGCRPASPQGVKPRFFRVAEQQGDWSFEDPQGRKFFSVGINVICPIEEGDVCGSKYDGLADNGGDAARWKAETLQRLKAWHVNTIGAWSSLRGMPYVLELSLSGNWMDVFDEGFETHVREAALNVVERDDVAADYAALDADPLLIGYFTDNELAWGWGHSWSGEEHDKSLFEFYASLGAETAGKKAWASYLAETYHDDWNLLSEVWTTDVDETRDFARAGEFAPRSPEQFAEAERVADHFLRNVAERYFEVTGRVMRGHLPHHLNLGTRLTPGFPGVVAETAGRHVDVVSFNMYTRNLTGLRRELTRLHDASGKPVLISEFAFPARENRSGNRNEGYENAEVQDDSARGNYLARSVDMFVALPFVVGYHWFQYHDEPTNGRTDGESSNFGFVDLDNRVYEDLGRAAANANAHALERRGSSGG